MADRPGGSGIRTDAMALVVGGSAGIGLALAAEFAAHGADVLIVGRDQVRLEAARAAISDTYPVTVSCLSLDAAAAGAPARLAEHLDRLTRPLTDVVIGVGRWHDGPIGDLTQAELGTLLAENVIAHQALARSLLPRLSPEGGVMFIGSLAGTLPLPWIGAYAASKAALHAMALALRDEVRGRGVRISVLAPGVVDTGFLPSPESTFHRRLLDLIASRPDTVARAGYLGFRANRSLIVPGLLWRGLWLGSHLVPNALRARIVRAALSSLGRATTPVADAAGARA